jgi:hypothetical protein
MGLAHRQYLRQRGFHPEQLARDWNLRGTTYLSKEWSWRIVFPICDQEGTTAAYCGRALDDEVRPKYRMSSEEQISQDPRSLLYGIHAAQESVVVVEGPSDVWRLGPGAVATLGIKWKPEQAYLLKQFPRRFVMFDPEPQAQIQARRLAEWLGMFSGETELIEGLESDPGSLPQVEADRMMKELGF